MLKNLPLCLALAQLLASRLKLQVPPLLRAHVLPRSNVRLTLVQVESLKLIIFKQYNLTGTRTANIGILCYHKGDQDSIFLDRADK